MNKNRTSHVAPVVKNSPVNSEDIKKCRFEWFLDSEDPLEEDIAIHFIILAWRIPWTEEPDGNSPWGHKKSDMTEVT